MTGDIVGDVDELAPLRNMMRGKELKFEGEALLIVSCDKSRDDEMHELAKEILGLCAQIVRKRTPGSFSERVEVCDKAISLIQKLPLPGCRLLTKTFEYLWVTVLRTIDVWFPLARLDDRYLRIFLETPALQGDLLKTFEVCLRVHLERLDLHVLVRIFELATEDSNALVIDKTFHALPHKLSTADKIEMGRHIREVIKGVRPFKSGECVSF